MKVISVPWRLRLGASLLLLACPLAALQMMIVARAPWWRLPVRDMGTMAFAAFLLSFPLVLWIWDGRKWAHTIASVLAGVWILSSGWMTIRFHNPTLGFFTALLILCFVVILFWIRNELGKSYIDPEIRWFQGAPRPVPDLHCEVGFSEKPQEVAEGEDQELESTGRQQWFRCSVGRLDGEGTFVFRPTAASGQDSLPSVRKSAKVELVFSFRDRQVRCQGMPVRFLHGNTGAGFRFVGLTPDMRKELGDFVERLRGQGYVD